MKAQTDPVIGLHTPKPNTSQLASTNSAPAAKPGSLSFTPPSPELGYVEETTSIAPETSPVEMDQEKKETGQENSTPPQKERIQTKPQEINPNVKATKSVANVIDKTNIKTNVHQIEHAHDKLTSIADKEEEEFIKEVETAHGHN